MEHEPMKSKGERCAMVLVIAGILLVWGGIASVPLVIALY
jgi:hypothetical protein